MGVGDDAAHSMHDSGLDGGEEEGGGARVVTCEEAEESAHILSHLRTALLQIILHQVGDESALKREATVSRVKLSRASM